jgi:Big-like domain-containing protein
LISSRFRSGALVACALLAVFLVGSTAAADDTTQPTLSIATSPQNPTPGTGVTITATVVPGTSPDSTFLAVSCDLSWAGKGSSSPLDPDATGLVFSRTVTVPSDAAPGERNGTCTVSDDEGRSTEAPYSVTIVSAPTDTAPSITSHTPGDGETNVAVDANIGITFSEPVDVSGSWFSISCDGTPHTAAVTGSATSYLLNPDVDFGHGEHCTVSLDSTLVTDSGSNDLVGTTSWSFTTVEAPANLPPTVFTTGPYAVAEGGSVSVSANGLDPEGGAVTYAWDLDGDGTFETPGQTVSFSGDDGYVGAVQNIAVRVTDLGGLTGTKATQVTIDNVPPTATFGAPSSAAAGFAFALSLTSPNDPSTADTAAGFTYAFDCGDGSGYSAFGSTSTSSCPTTTVGTRTVGAKIQDKDGGVSTYTATVPVTVTFASLCDLVRAYSTDPRVADDLCAKLEQAEAGSVGSLGAFRNQAYAKVNKGLTAAQADELNLLSKQL